jgi:class 3 adenylate cyclase
MARFGRMTLFGLGLGAALALAFAEWLVAADPAPLVARRSTTFQFSVFLMVGDRYADAAFTAFRAALSLIGIAACGVSAWIFIRATANQAARQVSWLLLGIAAFAFFIHFAQVDPRYRIPGMASAVTEGATLVALAWLGALVARFLVVFPRPLDGESVMATFWARRKRRAAPRTDGSGNWTRRLHDPEAPSRVLLPWHAALVNGRMVWLAPLAVATVALFGEALERLVPWMGWGGLGVTLIIVCTGWYVLYGLPFAWASPAHLYQNGLPEERRRVAWLRALGMMMAVAIAGLVLLAIVQAVFVRSRFLPLAGLLMLALELLPLLLVAGLAFAALRGNALDARLAFTRVTVWSFLGLSMTIAFLLVERYVAVKLVAWLSLPADSGAVLAGAAIAATFLPLRRATERTVTRIAERYLPLAAIAGGARVEKTVLICDLSGYTALSARDEPRALLLGALLKRQGERFAAANGGRLVKSMGDAVMVTFTDNAAATRAALSLHRDFATAADAVAVPPLPLHTALHRGEIVESHDGDIYGQTVNLCARLVDAAAAGEIVASATAIAGLEDDALVEPIGARRFKNVPEPVDCFRLGASPAKAPVNEKGPREAALELDPGP